MKPQSGQDSPASGAVRVEFQVSFTHGPRGARRVREAAPDPVPVQQPSPARPRQSRPPRLRPRLAVVRTPAKITRLLVLAHHFDALIAAGRVRDYAQLAASTGLSRARITQIANLTLLAPDIQETILNLDDADATAMGIFERALRPLTAAAGWKAQRASWKKFLPPQLRG